MTTDNFGKVFLGSTVALVYCFLLLPMAIVIIVSFTSTEYVVFPPKGLTLHWYGEALSLEQFLNSFKISLSVAALVSLLSTTIGTMASLALVRYPLPGKEALSIFFLSPLMFPSVVLGIGLLHYINTLRIVPVLPALVLGHIIITIPFVIRTVSAVLYGFDRSLEEAAMDLGAGRVKTFFKITLPLIKPGMINGVLFSFLISFGDMNISLFLSGPLFKTLPVQIYSFINLSSVDPTIAAISSLIIVVESLLLGALFKLLGSREIW